MGSLLRWFVFSVGFGLLPFAFSVLLRLLHGEPPELVQNAPELLFFALMLAAIQMGECVAENGRAGGSRARRDVVFSFFLLIGICAAVMYGVYVQALRGAECPANGAGTHPPCVGWVTFQSNVFSLSAWTAAFAAVVGTIVEATRTRRKRWNRWDRG